MNFFNKKFSGKPSVSQAAPNLRLMTAEVNSKISRESTTLMYSDKALVRSINEKNKDALNESARRYILASRRISGLELVNYSILQVQGQIERIISCAGSSSSSAPPALIPHLNTICCAAKFFKFDSFKTFINKVLIPSLGKETVSSLSSYHSLDPAVQRCFFEEDVSDEDKTKLILDAANHHLIDKEKVENILPIPKAVSPETKLCYPSPMDIVVDIPPTNVPPQSFHQPNNQIPNYENADCPNPNDTNQLTGPPQFQPPAPQFEKVDTPPASTRFSSQIPKDEPNQQNLTQDLPQYPDQATNEPVVPPTSISSNEVAQKDVQENTSLENENEKDENMNKANHVSAIPDDLLDYINNLDKKETGNPVPVQNPAPSSLSSSSSISDQNDNQYQYNENLFPVAPIPPFEKDNWYLLKDALQAATDYVE